MKWPLTRAVLLRLFANGARPERSLLWRLVLFLFTVSGLLTLAYWLAPSGVSLISFASPTKIVRATFAMIFLFITALFILFSVQQRSLLRRLELLSYLPLSNGRLRQFYLVAYLPVTLIAGSLAVCATVRFCGPSLGWLAWVIAFTASVFATAVNLMLELAAVSQRWIARFTMIALALVSLWFEIVVGRQGLIFHVLAVALLLLGLVLILVLWRQPIKNRPPKAMFRVLEHEKLGVVSAFCLRALRNRRYRAANGVIIGVFSLLSLAAWVNSKVVPFEAAAALTLLIAGTLGQEVRSLSSAPYAVELIEYGVVGRLNVAGWVLLCTNVAVIIDLILVIGRWLFPGQLGIGVIQMAALGFVLAAASALGSALAAPRREDIVGQLKVTLLYGLEVWGILKVTGALSEANAMVMLALSASFVALCIVVTWRIEKWRWSEAIRAG